MSGTPEVGCEENANSPREANRRR